MIIWVLGVGFFRGQYVNNWNCDCDCKLKCDRDGSGNPFAARREPPGEASASKDCSVQPGRSPKMLKLRHSASL